MEYQESERDEDDAALAEIENEGIQNVKRCVQKLYYIWDEFGIDKNMKTQRAKKVWTHLLNLAKDILEEEACMHKESLERVENYKVRIKELSSVLSVIPKEIGEVSLIKKEELLCLELNNLFELKTKLIKAYQDLKNTELEYLQVLNVPGHKMIHDSGIPTEKDINEIKNHIEMLKEEKEKRLIRLSLMKKELKSIWETTELPPETSIEKEIFSAVETFSLSNEYFQSLEEVIVKNQLKRTDLEVQKKNLLKKLTVLWERLQININEREEFLSKHSDCRLSTLKSIQLGLEHYEKIKMGKIEMFIDSLRKELNEMWDKCHVSKVMREDFNRSNLRELNDKALEAYECEVEVWKKYYEDVKHILMNILKREKLSSLKVILENKANDPNRFKNRKGNLLLEEKERKKLQRDLPLLETIIVKDIEEYESLNNCQFMYDGENYKMLITNLWAEKESEKPVKNLKSKMQLSARTPKKRPPSALPKSAPSKLIRLNAETPLTCTPSTEPCKILSSTAEKCIGQRLQHGCHLKNIHKQNQKMVLKESNQENSAFTKTSPNGTTYTDFVKELDSPARSCLRSSVLSTRRPSGSRISKSHLTKKNGAKSSRRSIRLLSSRLSDEASYNSE